MAKAVKKQALGRGLSALLNDSVSDINSVQDKNASTIVGSIIEIDLDLVDVIPYQPRTYFNEEAFFLQSIHFCLLFFLPIMWWSLLGN